MPTLRLTSGHDVQVSRALKRALDAASVLRADAAAEVLDEYALPALVLLLEHEVALVNREGARRWAVPELDRVEGEQILVRESSALPITSWSNQAQATAFRAHLRSRLGQPEPAPPSVTDTAPAVVPQLPEAPAPPLTHAPEAPAPTPAKTERDGFDTLVAATLWTVGGLVVIPIVLLVFLYAVGVYSLDVYNSDALYATVKTQTQTQTQRERLRDAQRFVPRGKKVYWLGRRSNGYHYSGIGSALRMGGVFRVFYKDGTHAMLTIIVSMTAKRPIDGEDDALDPQLVLAHGLTPNNQRVDFACARWDSKLTCPSRAVVQRLAKDLRILTRGQLPAD
jgi:hypothetical protein